MGFLGFFGNSSSRKKGFKIAHFIIDLTKDNRFLSFIQSIPEPMKSRLFLDNIIVSAAAAVCTLNVASNLQRKAKEEDYMKIMDSLIFKLLELVQKEVDFDVKINNIIVSESEKEIFLGHGWTLEEQTTIFTILSEIGYERTSKYVKLIAKGLSETMEKDDGTRITAYLMQESMKNCGKEGYPYLELKMFYTANIVEIFRLCSSI